MRTPITILMVVLLTGCATVPAGTDRNLTVGSVQRQVFIGMSGAEVAEALGSPNIVTTDEYRNETWIYDRIYTEANESESYGATGTLRFLEVWGTTRRKLEEQSQDEQPADTDRHHQVRRIR